MRTQDLTGAQLDWAVAKCEGVNEEAFHLYYEPTEPADYDSHGYPEFHYSTNWAQGGTLIEREKIGFNWVVSNYLHVTGCWSAHIPQTNGKILYGSTPLIAAMRVYVSAKLGDEINIPKELK